MTKMEYINRIRKIRTLSSLVDMQVELELALHDLDDNKMVTAYVRAIKAVVDKRIDYLISIGVSFDNIIKIDKPKRADFTKSKYNGIFSDTDEQLNEIGNFIKQDDEE